MSALGFDPAPGNLHSAQQLAERMAGAAATLREAADVLAGTGQQDWQGRTAEAFHGAMDAELTPRVATAADSFAGAATALETWATSLALFQQRARELEERARAATAELDQATTALRAAQQDEAADLGAVSARFQGATGALEGIRAEAQALAGSYEAEAADVAARLADAEGAAPDRGLFDGIGEFLADAHDFLQDYVLPVLEDLIDIIAVVVGVAAIVLLAVAVVVAVMNPVGLAAVLSVLGTVGNVGLVLGVSGVVVDGLQFAGGREGGKETLLGLTGLLAGGALGKAASSFAGLAAGSGGMSGLTPVLAGVSRGSGGAGATAAAALAVNPVGPLASWGYLLAKAKGEELGIRGTVDSVNSVGDPMSRTGQRVRNLIDGEGPVTDAQLKEAHD